MTHPDKAMVERVREALRPYTLNPTQAATAALTAIPNPQGELESALKLSLSALTDLLATVEGECPTLLDEDSGGSARLGMEVEEAIRVSKIALGCCPTCLKPKTWVERDCADFHKHTPMPTWHPSGLEAFNAAIAAALPPPPVQEAK